VRSCRMHSWLKSKRVLGSRMSSPCQNWCCTSCAGFSAPHCPAVHCLPWLPTPVAQVWTFILSDATFRLAPTQGSSRRDEQEVGVDRVKMVVVDQKLAPQRE
jgi:hypothetical protein